MNLREIPPVGRAGDVLLVRETVLGRGTGQLRGWLNCAGPTSYPLLRGMNIE